MSESRWLILDQQDTLEDAVPIVEELLPALLGEVDRKQWGISVLLTNAPGIQDYNKEFKGREHPTDVLSFSSEGVDESGRPYLGDLVISVEQAAEQGADYGNTAAEELQILVIHGVLHLMGMDHETDSGEMAAREQQLRERLLGREVE